MLDREMIEQLKEVYANLENSIELVMDNSKHEKQQELKDMLDALKDASNKISIKESGNESKIPRFSIFKNGKKTGIHFAGIPGGHEFTSLVLAILNTDGKGKLPEAGIAKRIKNLKGPVRIRTFVSLSCENCPDLVQAMNQMALTHEDFEHEMIDGGLVPEEVDSLGIQGVPSVVHNNKMIHSGKIQFLDLLTKLESTLGASEFSEEGEEIDLGHYDVLVVGGGPAGISSAIYSARKGLKTAILGERFGGQVQDTKGIENFISVPYTEGPELSAQLYKHLESYPIKIFEQRRVKQLEKSKKLSLEGGESISADSVIIATGAKWRELNVPGEKEYMGRGVAYCPHCDGPFYKGKKVAVVGGGNSGVEAAIDLSGIVREVVVIEYNDNLKADQVLVDKLKSISNISVITSARTSEIVGDGQKVNQLKYLDRKTEKEASVELDGVFIQIGLLPNSSFTKGTLDLSKFGEILVDEKGRTNVPGVYAAGDVTTTPYKQIIIAMGEGAKVALAAFEDRMYKKESA
ncbi:MAG: alkyl hydroperoxide reductase subunit F [Oligoflexia bacterium]|nr:alkyl hydroperoxide reductase subunit F [Oligoflexia bacterium]